MYRHRKAKIVATLGPSSSNYEVIKRLFSEGVDVFRLNFSHGTQAEHQKTHELLRTLEQEVKRPLTILMDLQGPKLRISTFSHGKVILKENQNFTLDLKDEPGNEQRVYLPHPEIFKAITTNTDLLIDDGKIRLRVVSHTMNSIETLVITGGEVSNRKGINLPGIVLPLSALTPKDRLDLEFGLNLGIDWVALSFVQNPKDVLEAQNLIKGRAKIISKLEKPMAINHLEQIVEFSNGIMVARGDLGVEIPPEEVPSIQKRIVQCCRKLGKPVVIATQMLDSMVHSPSPTRAEASDVATAIYDGVDAVMLSAESASGQYPIEAVSIMNKIILATEQDPIYHQMLTNSRVDPLKTVADCITASAREIAHIISIPVIVTFSESGLTPLSAARERPDSPVLALTSNLTTARFLGLVWGVHSHLISPVSTFSEMVEIACRLACQENFAQNDDQILVAAGVPFGTIGGTNTLQIAKINLSNF